MTDLSQRQWVNLGIQSGACMPVPDSCGVRGAALAFWMRLNANCSTKEGILSSHSGGKTGFTISCHSGLKLVIPISFRIPLLEIITLLAVQSVARMLIHNTFLFINTSTMLGTTKVMCSHIWR